MTFEHDDPRLSAWVLGELNADEAAEVQAAVEADPALMASAVQIQNLGSYLTAHLAAPTPAAAELRPVQRQAVYHAVRAPLPPVVTLTFAPASKRKQRGNPWVTGLTAAAMVALAGLAFFKGQQPTARRGSGDVPAVAADDAGAAQPTVVSPMKTNPAVERDRTAVGSPIPPSSMPDSEALSQNLIHEALPESWKLPTETAMTSMAEVQLPLVVGKSSYDDVRGWIRDRNQLPPKDAVRVEELANAFPLPPAQETVAFAGLRVACISMPSPWVEGARIVGVQIANETRDSRSVSWSFRPGRPTRGLRILASTDGDGKGNSVLPPNQRTLVLLELATSDTDCGDLVVNSEGRSRRFPAQETKDGGMTQAGLVAAFGLWLRGEGVDDSRLSQILVSAGDDPDPTRADSRRLIHQALSLAQAKRSKR